MTHFAWKWNPKPGAAPANARFLAFDDVYAADGDIDRPGRAQQLIDASRHARGGAIRVIGGNDTTAAAIIAAAGERQLPLKVVTIEDPNVATAAMDAYERRFVLVRPDRHVAWPADTLKESGTILDVAWVSGHQRRSSGQLGPSGQHGRGLKRRDREESLDSSTFRLLDS